MTPFEQLCRELLAERFGKLVPEYKNTAKDQDDEDKEGA